MAVQVYIVFQIYSFTFERESKGINKLRQTIKLVCRIDVKLYLFFIVPTCIKANSIPNIGFNTEGQPQHSQQ